MRTVMYSNSAVATQNKYLREIGQSFFGESSSRCIPGGQQSAGSMVWCWWWRQCTPSMVHRPFLWSCTPQLLMTACAPTSHLRGFPASAGWLIMLFYSPPATSTDWALTVGIVVLVSIPMETILNKHGLVALHSSYREKHSGLGESASTPSDYFLTILAGTINQC